jgi:hypothetical protein
VGVQRSQVLKMATAMFAETFGHLQRSTMIVIESQSYTFCKGKIVPVA